uniref:glutathione S-transferase Mu 1-like n=1 Tax=Styela clava TaxID=7725 RepID=UPI00193A4631|nr:glutathione S-transferase Mu 1-like [Styela clava]
MGKFVFTYWDLRGIAEPARMLLEYGGIEYEDRRMSVSDHPKWLVEKFSLGLDFPNLPYIIDGDVKLSESWAIYRYIGKKISLFPASEEDQRHSDMLQGVINDIRVGLIRFMYDADLYKKIDELRKNQSEKVDLIEKYLKGRKFLIGNDLSYLDFALFETFDQHRLFFTDIFDQSPNIQNYMERFESLPPIANYLSSSRYKFPITAPMATWGGQKENDRK